MTTYIPNHNVKVVSMRDEKPTRKSFPRSRLARGELRYLEIHEKLADWERQNYGPGTTLASSSGKN
jgi:hypothetical protein